jgi:hypothetical protein
LNGKALQEDDLLARKALLLDTRELGEEIVSLANSGDAMALRWIRRLFRYGVTPTMLNMIDRIVREVDLVHNYRLNPDNSKFDLELRVWGRVQPVPDQPLFPNMETVFCWILMRLVNDEIADTLTRCLAPASKSKDKACNNYFFARPNRAWCSKTCGSRVRAAKKRRKDRLRGAML